MDPEDRSEVASWIVTLDDGAFHTNHVVFDVNSQGSVDLWREDEVSLEEPISSLQFATGSPSSLPPTFSTQYVFRYPNHWQRRFLSTSLD
jgi:hypothetical protein